MLLDNNAFRSFKSLLYYLKNNSTYNTKTEEAKGETREILEVLQEYIYTGEEIKQEARETETIYN